MYQRDNVAFSIFVASKSEIQESEKSCESAGSLARIPSISYSFRSLIKSS